MTINRTNNIEYQARASDPPPRLTPDCTKTEKQNV